MIVAISGKKGSGKTTLAQLLQRELHYERKSFADPIYHIVSQLTHKPISYLKYYKEEMVLGKPIRHWLQIIGADLRNQIHPDIWVCYLMNQYTPQSHWIIDDQRYENEAEALTDVNSILIKLTGRGEEDTHDSEHGLDHWDRWDIVFDNSGDIQNLVNLAKQIAGAGELSPTQVDFHRRFGGDIIIAHTGKEAVDGILDRIVE